MFDSTNDAIYITHYTANGRGPSSGFLFEGGVPYFSDKIKKYSAGVKERKSEFFFQSSERNPQLWWWNNSVPPLPII
jgi:hypothetical protein